MGFIRQVLGNSFFSLVVFGLLFSKIHGGEVYYPTYGKHIHDVVNAFVKEMQKAGYRCTLTGGGTAYDVRVLDIGFMVYEKGSIENGREKIIFITEKFLEEINSHEGIRPYLREYPFPESRVGVSLNFCKPDNHIYADGSVTHIYHSTNSNIIYSVGDPNYSKPANTICEESYSEALALVNKTTLVKPISTERVSISVCENQTTLASRKRLGTLVTDLSGFGQGRELEALGIQNPAGQKEFASDIGELIGGICDLYFGEDFLERLARAVGQNSSGEFVEYWDNGQIKARIPYKNGYGDGHIHAWYSDGNGAFKGYYNNGKRVGIQFASYPREILDGNDPLAKVLEYDMDGKLHGRQQTSSSTNHLLAYSSYRHGVLQGSTSYYNGKGNGTCFGEWIYKKGKLVKTKKPSKPETL